MSKKLLITYALACLCQIALAMNADSLRVSFVTCYPGSDIYELEGHSALRVRIGGGDWAVSYGMFDFNAPNFVYRFVKGETDYWVDMIPWDRFLYAYTRDGRTMVEHDVPLDSVQAQRFLELLADNLQPEHRVYRYNYVKDNCSLRPLRLLQAAIGDSIVLPAPQGEARDDASFRDVMRTYHKNYPWYQFGIDLALGSGIDYPITDWEKAFAPVVLDTQLPAAMAAGRPVVSDTRVLYQGTDVTLGPTPWYLTPMCAACVLLALCIAFTVRDIARRRVTRWLDAVLYAIYGLAGLLLTFLIFVSVHEATSPNWLYLWLNPLCLIVPIFIWKKSCKIVVLSYQFLNFAMIMTLVIAWHWTGQSGNPAFVPLIACDALRSFSYVYVTLRYK